MSEKFFQRILFFSITLYIPTKTPEIFAQVVFIELATDVAPEILVPGPVAAELKVAWLVPIEVVDFLTFDFSANLISFQFTRHHESFNSASSLTFRIMKYVTIETIVTHVTKVTVKTVASGKASKQREKEFQR